MKIPTEQVENMNDLIFDEHMDTNFYTDFYINQNYCKNRIEFNPQTVKNILTNLRTLKYSIHIDKFDTEKDNLYYLSELIKNKSELVFILSELEKVKTNIQKQKLILNEAIKIYSE